MKQALTIAGTIFSIAGFLELIILSAISAFDKTVYSGKHHFIGFMTKQGLWEFFYEAIIITIIGIIFLFLPLCKRKHH